MRLGPDPRGRYVMGYGVWRLFVNILYDCAHSL